MISLATLPGPVDGLPNDQKSLYGFRGTATTLNGQPITQFAKPYTLQVPYTDAQLAAAGITDPAQLNLAFWNGNAWVAMLPCAGCSVDTANKLITVVADHFTDFALIGKVTNTNPGEDPGENPGETPANQIFLPLVVR